MSRLTRFADVNMTPLVDVMLVVLVLFLITSPLLLSGPEVTLPSVDAEPVPMHDTDTVITVTQNGDVYYRNELVTSDLATTLQRDQAFLRTRRIYVRGDRNAKFGDVSRVLTLTRRMEASGVNLVVDPVILADGDRR